VCGNHDVGNRPTPNDIQQYRRDFGDDYFAFWQGGVKFFALNSQYYVDDSMTKAESSGQQAWLEDFLEASTSRQEMINGSHQSQQPWKHLIGFQVFFEEEISLL